MDEPLIRDIPSFKKGLEDAKNLTSLKRVMPFLRPVLKLTKVDVEKIDVSLADVDQLARQVEELATIPDRFNDLFAAQGWISHDFMKITVAKSAIEKAESGDLTGAESDLVGYYDVETVRWKLQTMNMVEAFRPRMPLAQKALIDYEEGRYHACVPVVLALLDGLVNELHEKHRGFFSEGVDLTAWDSIAAHSRGLNVLSEIFKKGRRKTTTEKITIPYRNGILHGMDLGYDNKIVAAKTWAALFATRDWAIKVEKGEVKAPPEEPNVSWSEIFRQLRENAEYKKQLKQWRPRDIIIGKDIPEIGNPDKFDDGTPEQKLAEYLCLWKSRNYGYMARFLFPKSGLPSRGVPAHVREVFESKILSSFQITKITDEAAAVSEIDTRLIFEESGKIVEKSVRFRLINVNSDGNPMIRGMHNSKWTIINWAVY